MGIRAEKEVKVM